MRWMLLVVVLAGCSEGDSYRRPSEHRSSACTRNWREVDALAVHILETERLLAPLSAACQAARSRWEEMDARRWRAPRPSPDELLAAGRAEREACARSGTMMDGLLHSHEHLDVERQAAEWCEARQTRKRGAGDL